MIMFYTTTVVLVFELNQPTVRGSLQAPEWSVAVNSTVSYMQYVCSMESYINIKRIMLKP